MHDLTGKSFSVSTFSSSYDPMQDVQISTCLLAYTDEYGSTWTLVFNQVLWFGSSMDHSLINTNQIQMTEIPVSEYLFDENWKFGRAHKSVLISFKTDRTTVYFDLRVPTQREIMEYTHIVIAVEA